MVCGDHGQKNTLIATAKALMTSNLANGEVLVVGLQQVVHSFIVQLAEATRDEVLLHLINPSNMHSKAKVIAGNSRTNNLQTRIQKS